MNAVTPHHDAISLELLELGAADEDLVLRYGVHNGSPHRVLLINRLLRRTPAGLKIDPDLVYAHLQPEGVLHLGKQLIEIPDDLDVEVPDLPLLTPVAAGESFEETLRIPLPVMPHDPYRPQPQGKRVTRVNRLVWAVGYVLEDEPFGAVEVEMGDGRRAWRADFGELTMRQRIASVDVDEVDVPTAIATGRTP